MLGENALRISTEIDSLSKLVGHELAVEYIAKAGFDCWDFSLYPMCKYNRATNTASATDHPLSSGDYLAFARKLKQIGLDNGIVCNQSHAPHPTSCSDIRSYLKRTIECTAEAGGKICVIHPDNNKNATQNAEMFLELLPFAKSYNVKIATENMWNWNNDEGRACFAACSTPESFCEHINAINDDFFVACLDIGHSEMNGLNTNAVEMIKALGPKLSALHIHDNDKHNDLHQIPLSMDISFEPIIKALKDVGYSGDFTLESYKYLSAYTAENALDGVKLMADSAKKLVTMFEKM